MRPLLRSLPIRTLAMLLPFLSGCSPTATGNMAQNRDDDSATADEQILLDFAPPEIDGHSHDHEIGPHGGHVIRMQPSDQPAEWVSLEEDDTLQVYLSETKDISSVAVTVALEEGPAQSFDLTADESLGAGAYKIQSPVLMTAIKMKDAVKVNLLVTAAGSSMTVPIEHVGCSCGNH